MDKLAFNPVDHRYTLNGQEVPSSTTILRKAGLVDLSSIPPERLATAQAFGTAVHLACELNDKNDLDWTTLDPNLKAYVQQWQRFKGENKIVWTYHPIDVPWIELPVYSKTYRYAGTPDRIGMALEPRWKTLVAKAQTVFDIKTNTELHCGIGPQLASYQKAYNEIYPQGQQITQRVAVLLTADEYKIVTYKDPADWNAFIACLTVVNYKEKHR